MYGYALENPVNATDKYGLITDTDLCTGLSPRECMHIAGAAYYGAEGHYIVGSGLSTVNCTDECGRSRTFRYIKVCAGGAGGAGGAAGAGFTGGLVGNMNGTSCRSKTYQGWFFEAGYTAPWGGSASGDLGFNETDWKLPLLGVGLPYGRSKVYESGAGMGVGAGFKVSWCYYIPLD